MAAEALYSKPAPASLLKEVGYIPPLYRPYIESSPFMAVATCGPEGMDVSPHGDEPGFLIIQDEKHRCCRVAGADPQIYHS